MFTFDLHVLAGKGLDEFLFAGVGMTSREHVITHINKLNLHAHFLVLMNGIKIVFFNFVLTRMDCESAKLILQYFIKLRQFTICQLSALSDQFGAFQSNSSHLKIHCILQNISSFVLF